VARLSLARLEPCLAHINKKTAPALTGTAFQTLYQTELI